MAEGFGLPFSVSAGLARAGAALTARRAGAFGLASAATAGGDLLADDLVARDALAGAGAAAVLARVPAGFDFAAAALAVAALPTCALAAAGAVAPGGGDSASFPAFPARFAAGLPAFAEALLALGVFGLLESRFAMSFPPKFAAFVPHEIGPLFGWDILGRPRARRQRKMAARPPGDRHA
ncbi:hypothetical protein [Phreatobacter stygius]|uniref:hypothetical protein n=1 Tax=Phreatobacter stygius TaxID=1940610 RepID=UPI001FEBE8FA|nr:hypothetical protein [Phreatobacter stygius]